MRLTDWLAEQERSPKTFAERIGTSEAAVRRYMCGSRIPIQGVMQRIFEATGGDVTPNDFYNLDKGVGRSVNLSRAANRA